MPDNPLFPVHSVFSRRCFLRASATSLPALALARLAPAQGRPSRISTIAGNGEPGMAGDGDIATETRINNPYGVVIGPDGGLYWCDLGSHRVLRLDLEGETVSVIAGTGSEGYEGDGGPALQARLSTPHELRFDSAGDMVIAERDNHVVRKVNMAEGMITTVAGNGEPGYGGDGGPASRSRLTQPHSIALDTEDNVYICDIGNHRVRRIDAATGIITTFAGTGETGPVPREGDIDSTPLAGPRSIDIAPDGTVFLILREGNAVLSIDTGSGRLRHIAGTGELRYAGDGGPAADASFGRPGNPLNGPKGIAYSPRELLFIVDTENHCIRRIDMTTGIIDTVAGNGERGDGPDGGDPLACRMNRPHGCFLAGNTLFIGDSENHRIRALTFIQGTSD